MMPTIFPAPSFADGACSGLVVAAGYAAVGCAPKAEVPNAAPEYDGAGYAVWGA